jgi:hypothetical protein
VSGSFYYGNCYQASANCAFANSLSPSSLPVYTVPLSASKLLSHHMVPPACFPCQVELRNTLNATIFQQQITGSPGVFSVFPAAPQTPCELLTPAEHVLQH